jgi:hypothetical protein
MNGEIIKKKDLPKYVSLSPYLLDKCKELIEIHLMGTKYYIPITGDVEKIIKREKFGRFPMIKNPDLFQDVINSVYLQIRDDVGAGIHRQLSQQIEQGFSTLFNLPLAKKIDEELNKTLPSPKKNEGRSVDCDDDCLH